MTDTKIQTAKHTPGPWTQFITRGPLGSITDIDILPAGRDGEIAHVAIETPADEANARLIAAAPELLALAETFAATVEYYIRIDEKSGDHEGARMKAMTLHLINETIAKAGGAI